MPVTVQALINGSKGGRSCVELSKYFNRYFHRYPIFIGSLINLNDLINRTHQPRAGFRQASDQTGSFVFDEKNCVKSTYQQLRWAEAKSESLIALFLVTAIVHGGSPRGTASNAMRAEIATG